MSRKVEPTLCSLANPAARDIDHVTLESMNVDLKATAHLKPEARSSSAIQEAVVIPSVASADSLVISSLDQTPDPAKPGGHLRC